MQIYNQYPGLLKFNNLGDGITHFVTTRHYPDGSGNNFNIGFSGGNSAEIVLNRKKLADALGLKSENFVFQNQIHKTNSTYITKKQSGRGFYSKDTAIADNDILYTDVAGIMLITRSADCVPVLIHDNKKHAIAAVHSGREGTWLGAAKKTVEIFKEKFKSNPKDILVGIGPAICEKCYETDFDCGEKFINSRFSKKCYYVDNQRKKIFLNLKQMIAEDLISVGVLQENIEISQLCTKENPDKFFSARNNENQRFCAGIMINKI